MEESKDVNVDKPSGKKKLSLQDTIEEVIHNKVWVEAVENLDSKSHKMVRTACYNFNTYQKSFISALKHIINVEE